MNYDHAIYISEVCPYETLLGFLVERGYNFSKIAMTNANNNEKMKIVLELDLDFYINFTFNCFP